MTHSQYLRLLKRNLENLLDLEVRKDWDVAKESQDGFTRRLYVPKLDIAVGPFNTDRALISQSNEEISRTVRQYKDFLRLIFNVSIKISEGSFDQFLGRFPYYRRDDESKLNRNPRCFLAIEVEKSGGRKYMLGDIVNSSFLGKIGLVIALGQAKYHQFTKIRDYIIFAKRVKKLPYSSNIFSNVLIMEGSQFLRALREYSIR